MFENLLKYLNHQKELDIKYLADPIYYALICKNFIAVYKVNSNDFKGALETLASIENDLKNVSAQSNELLESWSYSQFHKKIDCKSLFLDNLAEQIVKLNRNKCISLTISGNINLAEKTYVRIYSRFSDFDRLRVKEYLNSVKKVIDSAKNV